MSAVSLIDPGDGEYLEWPSASSIQNPPGRSIAPPAAQFPWFASPTLPIKVDVVAGRLPHGLTIGPVVNGGVVGLHVTGTPQFVGLSGVIEAEIRDSSSPPLCVPLRFRVYVQ